MRTFHICFDFNLFIIHSDHIQMKFELLMFWSLLLSRRISEQIPNSFFFFFCVSVFSSRLECETRYNAGLCNRTTESIAKERCNTRIAWIATICDPAENRFTRNDWRQYHFAGATWFWNAINVPFNCTSQRKYQRARNAVQMNCNRVWQTSKVEQRLKGGKMRSGKMTQFSSRKLDFVLDFCFFFFWFSILYNTIMSGSSHFGCGLRIDRFQVSAS